MKKITKKYVVFFTLLVFLSVILVYLPTSKANELKEEKDLGGLHSGDGHDQMHVLLDEALRLMEVNPMEGVKSLVAVTETYPNEYEPELMLGVFSYQTGQYEKAIGRFERVLELLPEDSYNEDKAQSFAYLDVCYATLGMKEQSDSILNVWLLEVPESDTAVLQRIKQRLLEN